MLIELTWLLRRDASERPMLPFADSARKGTEKHCRAVPQYTSYPGTSVSPGGESVRSILEEDAKQGQQMSQGSVYACAMLTSVAVSYTTS